jgi:hypothetical protein
VSTFKKYIYKIANAVNKRKIESIEKNLILQGTLLCELNKQKQSTNINDYEFSVFSQWGDDGIIQYLTQNIHIENKTFIEFGVEDFFESNLRFLMQKDNWRGFVIDGSKDNISRLRNSHFFWKHDLQAIQAFIDCDNIESLLSQSGFEENLGILSIDIDGNDWHIYNSIHQFKPSILIIEYNSVFGPDRAITIPYDAEFRRTDSSFTNLFWGTSLRAITDLAESRDYGLVGCNLAGNNAFFVRRDLLNHKIKEVTVEEAFVSSHFRESRDKNGNLSFLSGDSRIEAIKGMNVLNTSTGIIEPL